MISPDQQLAELTNAIKLGNQNTSKLIQTLANAFSAQSAQRTSLGISYSTATSSAGGTLVVASTTYLIMVSVTTPSTGGATGKIYDVANTANVSSSNWFATIPSSGTLILNWPITHGIVVQPSSQSQVVSVSYV